MASAGIVDGQADNFHHVIAAGRRRAADTQAIIGPC